MNDTKAAFELPKYRCHKEVLAAKITDIRLPAEAESVLTLEWLGGHAKSVQAAEWMQRHKPQVGGYYVVYDDGYTSFSPAKAFEDGYTRL